MWRYVNLTLEVSAGDIIIWAHTDSAVTYIGRVTDVDVDVDWSIYSHIFPQFSVSNKHYRVVKLRGRNKVTVWRENEGTVVNAVIVAHRHIVKVLGDDNEVLGDYLRNWGRKVN